MSAFEQGEIQVEVVEELRRLADDGADVPELVEILQRQLGLNNNGNALFPVLIYFRAAFDLSLREVMPLREWLAGRDRSEIDSLLLPALKRNRPKWAVRHMQKA